MSLILLLFVCAVIGLNANTIARSDDLKLFTIDYFSTQTKSAHDEDCSLSFELYLNATTQSSFHQLLRSDMNITQCVLHWIHLRVFQLIDSSFLYNTDQYTSNLWNEYYLYYSDDIHHSNITITVSICVSSLQSEIQRVIETELQSDGDEVAAFIRYKLNKYIHNQYPTHTSYDIGVDLVFTPSVIATTATAKPTVAATKPRGEVWRAETYVIMIGACMVITGFIAVACCIDNKVKNAIKDIRSLVRIGHKFKTHSENTIDRDITTQSEMNQNQNQTQTNHDDDSISSVHMQPPSEIHMHSPEIPSTPDILKEPLPVQMHDDIHVNLPLSLPAKDSFKLTANPNYKQIVKMSVASRSSVSVRYDYNGNIKEKYSIQVMEIEANPTNTEEANNTDENQNTICYQDSDVLGTFKLVRDDELGDNLFSDVVID